jgi:50S ribosomal protein L16 3-hydroxylase
MAILETLIAPMTLEEFRRDFLFKKPFAAPMKAAQFQRLLSWPLLGEIFESGYDECWLPKQGRLPEDKALATGKLTTEQAMKGFAEGRSITIRHSERAHPVLGAIAKDFEALFRDPIDIQLYVTPPGEEGFDWHYDIEEVFVIQSSGEKEFYLREPLLASPLDKVTLPKTVDFNKDFKGPEIRCHLKAGDFLYIPAGLWHKARAITPSFHLSVGVMSSERRKLLTEPPSF